MVIEGIIFDLDGTIVNSEQLQFLIFKRWLKSYGKTLEWEYWRYHCFGKTAFEISKDLAEHFSIDIDNTRESLTTGFQHYRELIESGHLQVIDGFYDFLEWASSTGLSLIIASNSEPQLIEMTLKGVNLWNKIDFVSRMDAGVPKPDPEIYLAAGRRMGLSPAECLIIEDFPICVDTAKKIGSLVIAIKSDFDESNFANADLVIEDYNDQRLRPFICSKISQESDQRG
ncbi:MAG: HAD family hydrolase [Candidatus Odinarchaeota archaeon]